MVIRGRATRADARHWTVDWLECSKRLIIESEDSPQLMETDGVRASCCSQMDGYHGPNRQVGSQQQTESRTMRDVPLSLFVHSFAGFKVVSAVVAMVTDSGKSLGTTVRGPGKMMGKSERHEASDARSETVPNPAIVDGQ